MASVNLMEAINAYKEAGLIEKEPTLKAMANVLECPAPRLYSVAKQPKEGEVYDARTYNYDAVNRFVERRIKDKMTFDEFVEKCIEADKEIASSDKRHRSGGSTAADKNIAIPDGQGGVKLIPKRKHQLEVGQEVVFKKDDTIYKIEMLTDASVVLSVEGTPELRLVGNWTVNLSMLPPATRGAEKIAALKAKTAE